MTGLPPQLRPGTRNLSHPHTQTSQNDMSDFTPVRKYTISTPLSIIEAWAGEPTPLSPTLRTLSHTEADAPELMLLAAITARSNVIDTDPSMGSTTLHGLEDDDSSTILATPLDRATTLAHGVGTTALNRTTTLDGKINSDQLKLASRTSTRAVHRSQP